VAVLFVLQQEELDCAVQAQKALQRFFGSMNPSVTVAGNFSIGNGVTIDLADFRIDLGNGTVGGLGGNRERSVRLWEEWI